MCVSGWAAPASEWPKESKRPLSQFAERTGDHSQSLSPALTREGVRDTTTLVLHNVSEFESVFLDTADHMNRTRYHTLKLDDFRLVQRE